MRKLIEDLESGELTEAVSTKGIGRAYSTWREMIDDFREELGKAIERELGESFEVTVNAAPDEEAGGAGYIDIVVELYPESTGAVYPAGFPKWLQKQTGVPWRETSQHRGARYEATARPSFR